MPACATPIPCRNHFALPSSTGRRRGWTTHSTTLSSEPNRLDDESEGTNPNGHRLWEGARFDSRLGKRIRLRVFDLDDFGFAEDAGEGSERCQNERRVEFLLWWVLPIEKFDCVDGPRFGAEEYNQPQPIGQIRIACKICARIGCG
jgi:hypothetical protein